MIAATVDNVTVAYASTIVLHGLSCEVHDDRVAGLVGSNGSGKSTLLNVLAGGLRPSTGTVSLRSGIRIGFLPQQPTFDPGRSVFDTVRLGARQLTTIEQDLADVEARLSTPDVYENVETLERVLADQEALLATYERLGGPEVEARIRSLLHSLGFDSADYERPVSVLSGGQRKLVGIAAQALASPDLLLLDEPDNHLDLRGKVFLEQFLRGYSGGVVLVSHDRYLLDLVTDEILEIEGGSLIRFPGNYSEYAAEKEFLRAQHEHRYANQQKELSRLRQSADRLMMWGRTADNVKFIRRAQAIEKRIERMEKIEAPHVDRRMRLRLEGWRGSSKVLEISDLRKSFPSSAGDGSRRIVLAGLDMLLRHGERVGLLGPNGSGKSVLFRLIQDEEAADSGEIRLGPSVKVGYYAQQHETLDLVRSPVDNLRYEAGISETAAVDTLQRFAFTYDQSRRPAADLSGGERSRLQLAMIMVGRPNFLLLDEPTNNLDIASTEILEDAIEAFEGTVLAISHDRYFLDRVVDRITELRGGQIVESIGGYSTYAMSRGERPPN